MIRKLLAITVTTFILSACGGSSDGGGGAANNGGNTNTGGTGTGTGTGGTDTGGFNPDAGGQSGSFGDTADAANGIDPSSTICPASITTSFTGWADTGTSWCLWSCPEGAVVDNADGGQFGFIQATQETCFVSNAAAGTAATAPIFSAINGCPEGGCTDGSATDFPRVFVSATASNAELAGDYTCTEWFLSLIHISEPTRPY